MRLFQQPSNTALELEYNKLLASASQTAIEKKPETQPIDIPTPQAKTTVDVAKTSIATGKTRTKKSISEIANKQVQSRRQSTTAMSGKRGSIMRKNESNKVNSARSLSIKSPIRKRRASQPDEQKPQKSTVEAIKDKYNSNSGASIPPYQKKCQPPTLIHRALISQNDTNQQKQVVEGKQSKAALLRAGMILDNAQPRGNNSDLSLSRGPSMSDTQNLAEVTRDSRKQIAASEYEQKLMQLVRQSTDMIVER